MAKTGQRDTSPFPPFISLLPNDNNHRPRITATKREAVMTVRNRPSKWTKRRILPAAFVAMSGIGVAFAFMIPASAATTGTGTGSTPEEATNNANNVCIGQGLDPGSVTNQTQAADGSWQATVECVTRTNPINTGQRVDGFGDTPQNADIAARQACTALGWVAGNQVGMVDLGGGVGTTWRATVECLAR